jgi:hypothetical protein
LQRHAYRKIVLLATFGVLALLLSACGPDRVNIVQESKSVTTSLHNVRLQPGFVYTKDTATAKISMLIGLEWDESEEEDLILTLVIADGLVNIASKQSLRLNVDGEQFNFDSRERATRLEYIKDSNVEYRGSVKSFRVPLALIRQILAAKEVSVEAGILEGDRKGLIHVDRPRSILRGIREFVLAVDKVFEARKVGTENAG